MTDKQSESATPAPASPCASTAAPASPHRPSREWYAAMVRSEPEDLPGALAGPIAAAAVAGEPVASQLADKLQALCDVVHEGRLVPDSDASLGYVHSAVEAAEAALTAYRMAHNAGPELVAVLASIVECHEVESGWVSDAHINAARIAISRATGAAPQPSPGAQGNEAVAWAVLWGIEHKRINSVHIERRTADGVASGIRGCTEVRPLVFGDLPAGLSEEQAKREFRTGICVALTAITSADNGVLWAEIVRACGDDLLYHAAHVEPDEWEIAGFAKYAWSELRKKKPRARLTHPDATKETK